jgi:ATP-binding cassette, subfamily G (WHITE), member 2, SNQ2
MTDPAAFCIGQISADIPVLFFQVSMFSIVLYFMVGLTTTAGAFFTFWVIVFATTMCMTAMFRLVGAAFETFDAASKVSGFLIMALVMYTGYMISKPDMHPWFVWIYWIVRCPVPRIRCSLLILTGPARIRILRSSCE